MTSGYFDLKAALETCACPRGEGEVLSAPHCRVVLDTGAGDDEGPIFVEMPAKMRCAKARRLSYGEFCTDWSRIQVYRHCGI